MNNISRQIEELMTKTMGKVGDAAKNQDLIALEALTRRASELKQMKEQVLAIQQRLQGFIANEHVPGLYMDSKTPYGREIRVEVTQGMINQNLVTLTDAMNKGIVSAGEAMTIESLPSGRKFKTDVMANGNKLRERGEIRRFYTDARVEPGDMVLLQETSPGHWKLRKVDGLTDRLKERLQTGLREIQPSNPDK
ncbi:MAG: hypothetical protein JWO95_3343 [Verrucomicrobiales bacterium]|nr:hypothetical protein [Verrucomicrobiales bacterium]